MTQAILFQNGLKFDRINDEYLPVILLFQKANFPLMLIGSIIDFIKN